LRQRSAIVAVGGMRRVARMWPLSPHELLLPDAAVLGPPLPQLEPAAPRVALPSAWQAVPLAAQYPLELAPSLAVPRSPAGARPPPQPQQRGQPPAAGGRGMPQAGPAAAVDAPLSARRAGPMTPRSAPQSAQQLSTRPQFVGRVMYGAAVLEDGRAVLFGGRCGSEGALLGDTLLLQLYEGAVRALLVPLLFSFIPLLASSFPVRAFVLLFYAAEKPASAPGAAKSKAVAAEETRTVYSVLPVYEDGVRALVGAKPL
jgi:hypothetical protein